MRFLTRSVFAFFLLAVGLGSPLWAQLTLTVVHPLEGSKEPPVKQTFVYGAVTPGAMLTINGSTVPVHAKGGYIAMVPLTPGNMVLHFEARTSSGELVMLDRHITVEETFTPLPYKPFVLDKASITPEEDLLLQAGDTLHVSFVGSPGGTAEFGVDGLKHHMPMLDPTQRGIYEGQLVIPPGITLKQAAIAVTLHRHDAIRHAVAKGTLTIDPGTTQRVGQVIDDQVAVRTAPEGGYDLFLYKGMRVLITGKIGKTWRVRLSSNQTGWVKDSALQELPPGTRLPQSTLGNILMMHQENSTLIKVPLDAMLPYRTDEHLNPPELAVTLYGAIDRTDLIHYDPADTLIRQIRWHQTAPDTCQLIITPTFKKWWGYDVRYEGNNLIIEIRKPWMSTDLRGMIIAVDPGHGGPELGAVGPLGTMEKNINLAIAKVVSDTLQEAGAQPVLIRSSDTLVPLYTRPNLAWSMRARLYVSVHCNASGEGDNPMINNGYSVYFYQPQSFDLAKAIHAQYARQLKLMDHGLYYADFAVCRFTQMPAVLTEQAFIILPDQEQKLRDPAFHHAVANAILAGIRDYLKEP